MRSEKNRKMRFSIVIIMVLACTQCNGQNGNIAQEKDNIKTLENSEKPEESLLVNQQVMSSLNQFKLKSDSLSSYSLVKQSIKKQRITANNQTYIASFLIGREQYGHLKGIPLDQKKEQSLVDILSRLR